MQVIVLLERLAHTLVGILAASHFQAAMAAVLQTIAEHVAGRLLANPFHGRLRRLVDPLLIASKRQGSHAMMQVSIGIDSNPILQSDRLDVGLSGDE